MPRILRLIDNLDTDWPKPGSAQDFARVAVTELAVHPLASGIRRWFAMASDADLVHADGPAAIRAGYMLSRLSRLTRRLPYTAIRNGKNAGRLRLIGSGVNQTGFGLTDRLTRRALRGADCVVATSQAEANRYLALGVPANRLTLILPGVTVEPRHPDPVEFRRSLDIPENTRLVFVAGRFNVDSELRSAVWAFDVLRYTARDTYLILLGTGPQRERTERFARGLTYDDYRVRFLDTASDYPALFGLAEVVWVTHIRGGVDFALSGMAAGKPVVAFRTPDLAEVIEDGVTGKLVPVEDRISFAAATCEILADPTLANRLGMVGQARVGECHTQSRMMEQYAVLYERMVGR